MSSAQSCSPNASPSVKTMDRTTPVPKPATAPLVMRAARWGLAHIRRVLLAYSQVLFSKSPAAGAAFLLATLVAPGVGLAGLTSAVLATAWARALGRSDAELNGGFFGFNGLLVGLALGSLTLPFQTLVGLLVLGSLLSTALASSLQHLLARYVSVPALCMPFVLVTWVALAGALSMGVVGPVSAPGAVAAVLPNVMSGYLAALGAIFFQPNALAGALVFTGLLLASRWAVILSAVGYSFGIGAQLMLGQTHAVAMADPVLGFNAMLCAIAVGGVFVLLSPSSIIAAALVAALSSLVTAALAALLKPLGLPVLAMPFVVVTQLTLFVLLIRARSGGPVLVQGAPLTPEANLQRTVYRSRRYPDPAIPAVWLPVLGRWVVTQGHDGEHTHQGLWAHAWDFEVQGEDGRPHKDTGARLEDWYAFGAPVFAPAGGRVASVVNHVDDNPVHEVDTRHNWGNVVVIEHAGGIYSVLSHLQKGSVEVAAGQSVERGHKLARVGNSGRSPVPHLHFQLQRSPELGAPTCFGQLLQYSVDNRADDDGEDTTRYVTCGVPQQGEVVSPIAPSEAIRSALTLAPGRSWTWRVLGTRTVETWESRIDPLGERALALTDGTARAAIFADDRYTTVLDYDGRGDALLGLFALGLPRAPFTAERGMWWTDAPAATPFVSVPLRLIHELALPFCALGAAETRSSLEQTHSGARVTTWLTEPALADWLGARLPSRIDIDFVADRGPVRITTWRDGRVQLEAEVIS